MVMIIMFCMSVYSLCKETLIFAIIYVTGSVYLWGQTLWMNGVPVACPSFAEVVPSLQEKHNYIATLTYFQSSVGTSLMKDVISAEKLLLQTYNITLHHPTWSTLPGPTDAVSVEIIRQFQPVLLNTHYPLKVGDDGNCFYRAFSRGLYGTEQKHLHLRLLTALDMAEHPKFYNNTSEECKNLIGETIMLCDSYNYDLIAAFTPRKWAILSHLYAASGALQIKIWSYCPPVLNDHFVSTPLSRKICGHGVSKSALPLTIMMWTCSIVPNSEGEFRPDHFSVLLPTRSQEDHVDLTVNQDSSNSDSCDNVMLDQPMSKGKFQPDNFSVLLPTRSLEDHVDMTMNQD